jgi:hypothetical protein
MDKNEQLENLRNEIAILVSEYTEETYKLKAFVIVESVISPVGKMLGLYKFNC